MYARGYISSRVFPRKLSSNYPAIYVALELNSKVFDFYR